MSWRESKIRKEMEEDLERLGEYRRETHERAYAALNRWSIGILPPRLAVGICGNLDDVLYGKTETEGYSYAAGVFRGLGYDTIYPLGTIGFDPWWNKAGADRRELCARMADYIKDNYLG